jgi:hypothetical protein
VTFDDQRGGVGLARQATRQCQSGASFQPAQHARDTGLQAFVGWPLQGHGERGRHREAAGLKLHLRRHGHQMVSGRRGHVRRAWLLGTCAHGAEQRQTEQKGFG